MTEVMPRPGYDAGTTRRHDPFDDAVAEIVAASRGWAFLPQRVGRQAARWRAENGRYGLLQQLLDELRTDFGFRIPDRQRARLIQSAPRDVDGFTDALFAALGLHADRLPNLRGQVTARVANVLARNR